MRWNRATLFIGLFFCITGGILFCAGKVAGGNDEIVNSRNIVRPQDKDIITMKKQR